MKRMRPVFPRLRKPLSHLMLQGGMVNSAVVALMICLAAPSGPAGAADLIWTDDDWSAGHYARRTGVDPEIDPGTLVLNQQLNDFRLLSEPTQWQGMWSMASYHDTLFITASPYPYAADGADILAYDYLTNNYEIVYQPQEQGLHLIKAMGDTLYLPGPDTVDPLLADGSIYTYDGQQWLEKQTLPMAAHVNDIDIVNGRLYVSSCQGADYYEGCGVVSVSDDWGETFRVVLAIQPTPDDMWRRMYALGHSGNRIFAQPDGGPPESNMIFTSLDGENWDTLFVNTLPFEKMGTFVPWTGDSLLLGVDYRMYIWTGSIWRTRALPFNMSRWGRGLHEYKGDLYGGGQSCTLYRWIHESLWEQIATLPVVAGTQNIGALETYHGRVYLSTWASADTDRGKLFVSASLPSGTLESLPHDFGGRVHNGVISWDDFRPAPGSMAAFQIRSSASLGDLYMRPYLGPDGTNATWFEESGTALPQEHHGSRWFQYKVELRCPDGMWMPLLRSVTVEADSLPSGAVSESETNRAFTGGPRLELGSPEPNPARSGATFRLALAPTSNSMPGAMVASISVRDLLGRLIRAAAVPIASSGAAQWQWDLRDGGGQRVSAGIYHVTVELSGTNAPAVTRSLVVVQ